MAVEIPDNATFLQEWNALPLAQRRRTRRLVRLGRPLPEPEEARLGVAYAQFQRSRIWARTFWLWFLPGLIVALGVAARVHPLFVGIVLAFAAQAVWAHRNAGRVERINATVLNS
ncbi:MAG: hypothetical protein M3083_23170 [Actinomycetota bacterium]|nr:hypothetical protein [Actinomycetota bacterium]